MMWLRCLSVSMSVAALVGSVYAQTPVPAGPIVEVSVGVGYGNTSSSILLGEDGFAVIAWTTWSDEEPLAVLGSQVTESSAGPSFVVGPAGNLQTARGRLGRLLAAADGRFFAAWTEVSTLDAQESLRGRWMTAQGVAASEPFILVEEVVTPTQFELARQVDGNLFLVWWTGSSLLARTFSPQGDPLRAAVDIQSDGDSRRSGLSLDSNADGRMLVVWSQGGELLAQHFRANGEKRGEVLSLGPGLFPSAQLRPDGSFLTTWSSEPLDAASAKLFLQAFDAMGVPLQEPSQIAAEGQFFRSKIVETSGDGFLVAWERVGQHQQFELAAQRFDGSGLHLGAEVAVRPPQDPTLRLGDLVFSDGRFLISWSENDDIYAGGTNVRARYYSIGPCLPTATTACLRDRRFEVEIEWRDFEGVTGRASPVPVKNDESGLFWFFNDDNWEMLVKVLDGCEVNGHFWVFAATASTVEFTLRVHDLANGTTSEYHNPLGQAAPAIADIRAFPACP